MELDEYLAQQRQQRKRNKHEERDEQVHFVHYVHAKYPGLPMWVSPIFKFSGTPVARLRQGKLMKAMGYTPGTPDITFLESKKCYSGLVLEFKKTGEKVEKGSDQERILEYCRKQGKSVHEVHSCDEAVKIVDWYMKDV
jgi:hypothetical protein